MKNGIFILLAGMILSPSAFADNLHLIDQNRESGFSIFRTGDPDRKDMRELCAKGIEEMMVLSGDARKHEEKYAEECPTLKVIYNVEQDANTVLTEEFLQFFDQWVEDAKRQGKKIAFRCNCGCHRTGRLAAYYQMKVQNLTAEDAIAIMEEHGKHMWFFPSLDNQVRALYNYIHNEPCSGKYCIRSRSSEPLVLR